MPHQSGATHLGIHLQLKFAASLKMKVYAQQSGGYEQVVKAAISLGHDTDTTACIAGGIAGIRDGIGAIPKRWRAQLRGTDLVEPLVSRLIEWHALQD